ncbi:ANTAR domain-containing response regulator [Vibrio sp. WJH972]
MTHFSSNDVVVLCSDDQAELPMLSSKLTAEFAKVKCVPLPLLELTLDQNPTSLLVISYHKPTAELSCFLDYCSINQVPVVVLLKDVNSNYIKNLNGFERVVLLPFSAVDSLIPMLIHAKRVSDNAADTTREIAQLKRKLEDRKWVEKAKGLLMKVHSIDEPEAYQALRSSAMKSSQPMGLIAKNVVNTFELTN